VRIRSARTHDLHDYYLCLTPDEAQRLIGWLEGQNRQPSIVVDGHTFEAIPDSQVVGSRYWNIVYDDGTPTHVGVKGMPEFAKAIRHGLGRYWCRCCEDRREFHIDVGDGYWTWANTLHVVVSSTGGAE